MEDDQLTPEEREYAALLETETEAGETQATVKKLPEGFNPQEYGLVSAEELEKQRKETVTERKRVEDTQRAYHESQTHLGRRMQELETRLQQQPLRQADQPVNSRDLLVRYQQNPQDINAYDAYIRQVNREIAEENMRKMPQVDPNQLAQQAAYISNPAYRDLPPVELQKVFAPEYGGTPPSLEEMAIAARVRKAGGVDKYHEAIRIEGETRFKDKLTRKAKEPRVLSPGSAGRREFTTPSDFDWEHATDEQAAKEAQRIEEREGVKL
jgi:hypothetical protein